MVTQRLSKRGAVDLCLHISSKWPCIRSLNIAFCIGLYIQDNSEVTALQEKLSQTNNKVAEFRNQCEKLKKDLKVAHKVSLKKKTLFGDIDGNILSLRINWQS